MEAAVVDWAAIRGRAQHESRLMRRAERSTRRIGGMKVFARDALCAVRHAQCTMHHAQGVMRRAQCAWRRDAA
jgi:hypothetical protein